MANILNKTLVLCRSAFHKNIISGPINKNMFLRNIQDFPKTNLWAEQKYKLKDNISDGYRLIYREYTSLNILTIITYHAGLIGTAGAIFSIGYLICKRPPLEKKGMEGVVVETVNVFRPLTSMERALLLCVSFVVSIVLFVGSKTIPFRIYYNSTEKMYKAVFVNRIFGKKQMETFGEGTIVPVLSRKSLGHVLFNINGRIVLFDKECFQIQSLHERMIRKTEQN